MVCAACNGKGYVIERGRESTCSECQGRGEYPLYESIKLSNFDSRESREASCSAPLSH
jgi:DnaJ-class molecular chaperone